MPFIAHLLRTLAWRAATDPRVRAGAAQAARNLKPKAKAAVLAVQEAAREAPPDVHVLISGVPVAVPADRQRRRTRPHRPDA